MATCSNRGVLGPSHKGVAEGGVDKEEMADVDEQDEAAEQATDVMMADTATATTTAIDTKTQNETRALAAND